VARVIAHRAGNDLPRFRKAEELGFEMIEADVRLWRSRLEIRHLDTVGPLPILWGRWTLAKPLAPRLLFRNLLAAASPQTGLLLDSTGHRHAPSGGLGRHGAGLLSIGMQVGVTFVNTLVGPRRARPDPRHAATRGHTSRVARRICPGV
jgi:hypothetical protein